VRFWAILGYRMEVNPMSNRAIFRGPKRAYQFTDSDVEWLARSMWGEASDDEGRIAVCWTHINRFLLVKYRWLNEGWSFKQYVQSHSQPINPDWRRDGKFCRPGGKYHGNQTYCNETQLARRDKYQTQPVPAKIYALAEKFAAGDIPTPFVEPTYDFAACWLTKKQGRPNPGVSIGGNCHLTYSSLKPGEVGGVLKGYVSVEGSSILPPSEITLPFLGLFLAGTGAAIALYLVNN